MTILYDCDLMKLSGVDFLVLGHNIPNIGVIAISVNNNINGLFLL